MAPVTGCEHQEGVVKPHVFISVGHQEPPPRWSSQVLDDRGALLDQVLDVKREEEVRVFREWAKTPASVPAPTEIPYKINLVHEAGLEPARLSALEPKSLMRLQEAAGARDRV